MLNMLNTLRAAPEDVQFVFVSCIAYLVISWAISEYFGLVAHYIWLLILAVGTVFLFYAKIRQGGIDILIVVKSVIVLGPTLYYFLPKFMAKLRGSRAE